LSVGVFGGSRGEGFTASVAEVASDFLVIVANAEETFTDDFVGGVDSGVRALESVRDGKARWFHWRRKKARIGPRAGKGELARLSEKKRRSGKTNFPSTKKNL